MMRDTIENWRERAQTANMGRRMVVVVITLLLVASPLVGVVLAASGTVVDDFEDGIDPGWTFSNDAVWSQSNDTAAQGTYSLRYDGSETAFAEFNLTDTTPDNATTWFRYGTTPTSNTRFFKGYQSTGGDTWFQLFVGSSDTLIVETSSGQTQETTDTGIDINPGTWYRYRVIINYGDRDYDVEVYDTNGGLVGSETNINLVNGDNTGEVDTIRMEADTDIGVSYWDYVGYNQSMVPGYSVSGTVVDSDGQGIDNATVNVENTIYENTTDTNGEYGLQLENGTYTLTASKNGFKDSSITVEVNGSSVTGANITMQRESDPRLILDTRSLIKHNESHPYTVRELVQEGDRNISYTVTDNATVTSLNTTLLTVNNTTNTLNATADENLSGVVVVKAEYNGSISYTNVTVAQPTVENLEIVPGIWRVSAVVGDDYYFFLLLATLMAVPVARFTSAFGGLAIGEMILVVGWLGGYVGFGMAAVSVFISLFIGLNLAANINYTAGRFDRG